MKHIKMTDEIRAEYLKSIEKQLKDMRTTGKIQFSFTPETQRLSDTIKLDFTAMAWLKMWTLISNCKTECAWHGVVEASEDRTYFIVKDILVYPQVLTGATVEQDDTDDKYDKWHNALDNKTYNNLRLQGHSHVNFAATPSGRDDKTYENILNNLREDSYYIFMIANKKGMMWVNIYNLKQNAIFDEDDIDITVDGVDTDEWYAVQCDDYFAKPAVKYSTKGPTSFNGTPLDHTESYFGHDTVFDYPERTGSTLDRSERSFFGNDTPQVDHIPVHDKRKGTKK